MRNAQSTDVIQVVDTHGIALIELARPDRKNAFEVSVLEDLSAAIDAAVSDARVKAIMLAGRGAHFSSGASPALMAQLRDATPLEVQGNVYDKAQGAARRLYNCPKPTIALVSGAAVTLGCELALACDFRIIDETAFFEEAWIRLGLLPPLGGMFLLPRMVGVARASEMILQGRRVKAGEAQRIGLAHELVPADQLRARGTELAIDLASIPPQAYRLAKQGFHRGLESTMEIEWSANALAQAVLMSTEDFAEGVAAVTERRTPSFAGR